MMKEGVERGMLSFKWLFPGLGVKRWLVFSLFGALLAGIGTEMVIGIQYLGAVESLFHRITQNFFNDENIKLIGLFFIAIGFVICITGIKNTISSVINLLIPKNKEKLIDILYEKRHLKRGPRIVVIGGGTGLSVLLRGLKEFTSNITAIVTVSDDGGSSGRLRGELGILPPGDIRNCVLALADTEPLMEKLFQYRFTSGSLEGHSFGNLFIAVMTDILGDFELAIKEFSKVLAVRGQVLPATLEDTILCAEMEDGEYVEGESAISTNPKAIRKIYLKPENARPLKESIDAIRKADAIILGPGSLYTSVIPNLLVRSIPQEIQKASALKIFVVNVMTQLGETKGFKASDHVKVLLEYGGKGLIEYAVVNTSEVPEKVRKRYEKEGAEPVMPDAKAIESMGIKTVTGDFINKSHFVRHDSYRLARTIMRLIFEYKFSNDKFKILDLYFWGEKLKEIVHID